MKTPANSVVVAIGTDGYDAAVRFAVAEARRTGRPLHLVHVLQLPAGEAYTGVYGGLLDGSKQTLEEATALTRELAREPAREPDREPPGGDLVVTSELVDNGWVVDELVRHSETAALIVMQHRAMSRVKRLFVGSMVQSTAGRAHTPVVSVPEGWSAEAAPTGVVTAAVQDPVEAPALLRVAFEEARARGAELVVLHAWWLASGFDVVVVDGAFREEWAARSREEIAPVLAPLQAEYADVTSRIEVRHAPPAESVLDAAAAADLLILGRRHHLLPLGSHIGPVARTALDHSTCPVLVTPELAVPVEATDTAHEGSTSLAAAT